MENFGHIAAHSRHMVSSWLAHGDAHGSTVDRNVRGIKGWEMSREGHKKHIKNREY